MPKVKVGCIVNTHDIGKGSSNVNPRVSKLLQYLAGSELQIFNLDNEPTFFNVVKQEIIDITVTSLDIVALVREWRISNDIKLSNHKSINFVMGMDPVPPTCQRTKSAAG